MDLRRHVPVLGAEAAAGALTTPVRRPRKHMRKNTAIDVPRDVFAA
ncbi:MAG: hypothetical protein KJ006_06985 [Thermoleophilia bacterium]|nr:hypothetical protein [Thermoleophilia bacterium]